MANEFDLSRIGAGLAGGAVGGTVAALSRPMNRKEVLFSMVGGVGLGAFIPPLAMSYYETLPPMLCGSIGFACGLSVFGLISLIQSATMRFARNRVNQHVPPEQDDTGGGP